MTNETPMAAARKYENACLHTPCADTTARCPLCGNAGWILDCRTDRTPLSLELIACIHPECTHSGRAVELLSIIGPHFESVAWHPTNGFVMSLSRGAKAAAAAVVVWEPIAWCAGCEWYLPAEDAGTRCPGDDCKHILRRRLARICRRCEEHPAFLSTHGDDYDALEAAQAQVAELKAALEWESRQQGAR